MCCHRRLVLIACADQRSADLFNIAISRVGEVWPGSKLEAVSKDKIPSRPRSRAWFPAEPSDPKEILELIQLCNPTLPTEDWKVAKVGEVAGGKRHVVVILNEDSITPILEKNGVIHYGFTSITLHLYANDTRNKREMQLAEDIDMRKETGISEGMFHQLNAEQEMHLPSRQGDNASFA